MAEAKRLSDKSFEMLRSSASFKVYEGSVRSTKTVTSLIDFYNQVLASKDSVFLMTGNTLGSISRNCINGDFGFIEMTKGKAVPRTDTDGSKFLQLGNKKIYYCGADNAASYKKIKGLSIGGWYADEIDLHDWEFLQTAEGRLFAATKPFTIWTLNPTVPGHKIYKERIDAYLGKDWYKWMHFVLDDNPGISEERKEHIKSRFTGVFYERYVLGLRVRAEGGCYPSFSDINILREVPKGVLFVTFGADIGGSSSASTMAATGYFIKNNELCAVLLDDLYITHKDSENGSTQIVIDKFAGFIKKNQAKYPNAVDCYVDSAEQLMKGSIDNLGLVNAYNSLKKPIIDRIRFFDLMFARERLFLMAHCEKTIEAIQSAVYNLKAEKEERLDDGTVNIDSIDCFEYSVEPHIQEF